MMIDFFLQFLRAFELHHSTSKKHLKRTRVRPLKQKQNVVVCLHLRRQWENDYDVQEQKLANERQYELTCSL